MFGLGVWEIGLILIVGLLVLGPERLPKVARQLGKVVRELRRAASDFQVNMRVDEDYQNEDKTSAPKPAVAAQFAVPRPPDGSESVDTVDPYATADAATDGPSTTDGEAGVGGAEDGDKAIEPEDPYARPDDEPAERG